jgi:rod shape-determining protein MreC
VKTGQFIKEVHLSLSGAPGSVDEVLVVLEGVHQQIPKEPPQQKLAKSLPPAPRDTTSDKQMPTLATEADKIKQTYQELGKQQNHEFGAVGSSVPNFNPPPAQAPAGPTPQTKPREVPPPASAPENAPPRPGPSASDILGGRTQKKPEVKTDKPAAAPNPAASGPVLPLGAPRKKPSAQDQNAPNR